MFTDKAHTYVRRIRNKDKKHYAQAYLNWREKLDTGPPPIPIRLNYMGAQAVRLAINALITGYPEGDH